MKEVLCARTPAVLQCGSFARTMAFYRDHWGFGVVQHIPGMLAILRRESVTVQLWQHSHVVGIPAAEPMAFKLLVESVAMWQCFLKSAKGQPAAEYADRAWGAEFGLSDCDGNRLLLIQTARKRPAQMQPLPSEREWRA